MKKITFILSLGLIISGIFTGNAQFLKKLKDKVNKKVDQVERRIENKIENKVDQKIDKALDGTIDGLFEESSKTPEYSENQNTNSSNNTEEKTYSGTISLDHGQIYGNVQINTLDNLKIERTNQGYNFYGSWFSHEVDIFDGYKLEIQTDENLELGKTYTFNIPKDANLRVGYDPELPATKGNANFKRGVSDEYQNLDLSSGLVKVKINEDKSFDIDFSGQAEFVKRTRTANNEVTESNYTASVMGNIQGTDPKFLDNKTITKNTNSQTQTASSVPNTNSSNNSAQAKDSYVFTYETVVEMTVPDQNRKNKLSYLLNPNANYMGMKADMSEYSGGDMGGESLIVMDGNQTFVFVNTSGMKIQMSSAQMGNQQQMPSDQMENYDYTNLNKTGKTKTILGYTCYEYVMSDNQNSIQMWIAPDLEVPNWFMQNQDVIQGHILEYSVDSPDGQMTITTLEIKDDINKTINPSEYKKMF
jgi:hypothetical protein